MGVQPYLPYLVTGTSVLTEQIFIDYGGQTGTATNAQVNAALQMGEQFAIQEIRTFLVPTSISGTFAWPADDRLLLPHTHIRSVDSLTAIHEAGCDCADDQVEISGCAWILDYQAGIISLRECGGNVRTPSISCNCSYPDAYGGRLLYQIVYEAGIQAGLVAANSSALMGLVTAADLALEQIVDPQGAEAGPGDASVSSFSDTGYSESRQFLLMTSFGGSPRANYAARMLQPLKYKRALKL